MFIQLIYGARANLIINPESQVQHIMDLLKNRCNLDIKRIIELLPLKDTETVPQFYWRTKTEFLAPYVNHRSLYVPAYMTCDRHGRILAIEPQVMEWASFYPELETRIKDMVVSRAKRKSEFSKRLMKDVQESRTPVVEKKTPTKKAHEKKRPKGKK